MPAVPEGAAAVSGVRSVREPQRPSAKLCAALEGRDEEALAEETLEQKGTGAEQSRSRPSRVAPSVAMQATPPWVRMPLRNPPNAHLRPDLGERERGTRSEPGTPSSEGSYNFRRVAIRRKSNVSYLPPGTPRPWCRPVSPLRWAETSTFRPHVAADAPGKCLGRKGMDGGVGAGRDTPSALRVRRACRGSQPGRFSKRAAPGHLPSYAFCPFPQRTLLGQESA